MQSEVRAVEVELPSGVIPHAFFRVSFDKGTCPYLSLTPSILTSRREGSAASTATFTNASSLLSDDRFVAEAF